MRVIYLGERYALRILQLRAVHGHIRALVAHLIAVVRRREHRVALAIMHDLEAAHLHFVRPEEERNGDVQMRI